MNSRNLPLFEQFFRKKLFDSPTPIQRLDRLEHELKTEVRLYVKRDDLMGLGGGGNKLRKLEFLLGDAISQGSDTFITVGGLQSNHARLSAAAAAYIGMTCELVLAQVVPRSDEAYRRNGNILLDEIFGAKIHLLSGTENALDFAEDRAKVLKSEGRRPYLAGSGGSSPVGCLGYANCAMEIMEQQQEIEGGFSQIVVPNGSSGTHAGLAAGFAAIGMNSRMVSSYAVLGPAKESQSRTHELAKATLALLDPTKSIDSDAIHVSDDQLGDGYGIPSSAMLEAVRTMARTQGLLLDPVYTGKAFAGFLAAVRSGVYQPGEAILFLMTGGFPGLFAYQPAFEGASEK
jgi:L-cysteate sulfo-lyase